MVDTCTGFQDKYHTANREHKNSNLYIFSIFSEKIIGRAFYFGLKISIFFPILKYFFPFGNIFFPIEEVSEGKKMSSEGKEMSSEGKEMSSKGKKMSSKGKKSFKISKKTCNGLPIR